MYSYKNSVSVELKSLVNEIKHFQNFIIGKHDMVYYSSVLFISLLPPPPTLPRIYYTYRLQQQASASKLKLMFSCKRWQMAVISFESEDVETILLNVHTHRCCIVLYMGDVPSLNLSQKAQSQPKQHGKNLFHKHIKVVACDRRTY